MKRSELVLVLLAAVLFIYVLFDINRSTKDHSKLLKPTVAMSEETQKLRTMMTDRMNVNRQYFLDEVALIEEQIPQTPRIRFASLGLYALPDGDTAEEAERQGSVTKPESYPTLQSILIGPQQRLAVINEHVVLPDEMVPETGWKVTAIDLSGVTLVKNGGLSVILRLNEQVIYE